MTDRRARLRLLRATVAVGLIAVSCTSGGATDTTTSTAPPPTPAPTSAAPPPPTTLAPTTTTAVTTTTAPPATTTTVPPTTTQPPPNAVAVAGDDFATARLAMVALNGSASSDPDGDPLSYTWTQTYGPDVTAGVGFFVGATPTFTAPAQVSTLMFELVVDDGNGPSPPDPVRVDVFETTGARVFVDGSTGSDETGDGTAENPFASVGHAVSAVSTDTDIYVMALPDGEAYEEPVLNPPSGVSFYGGYGPGWVRDLDNLRSQILGPGIAMWLGSVDQDTWISGFDITGADAAPSDDTGNSSAALVALDGEATLYVEHNILRAGNGYTSSIAGWSFGLLVFNVEHLVVANNSIFAGNGSNGLDGNPGQRGATAKSNGGNGANPGGGAAGRGFANVANGGRGGAGGSSLFADEGTRGSAGSGRNPGAGGSAGMLGQDRGGPGRGGAGGQGGLGGEGGAGDGIAAEGGNVAFVPLPGQPGSDGSAGSGGGGGGGGAGLIGLDGGGGGGGGGGGEGGSGGEGGTGGGGSIGIVMLSLGTATIENNTIVAGNGGSGGDGGAGGRGGSGVAGGRGGSGECSFLGCGVARSAGGGGGGGGGAGGSGGTGGGGGGGPSYGIAFGPGFAPVLTNNSIAAGVGGSGGDGGRDGQLGARGSNGDFNGNGGDGACCAVPGSFVNGSGGFGGYSYAVFDARPDDASVAVMDANTLLAGSGGAAGTGGNAEAGSSGERNF